MRSVEWLNRAVMQSIMRPTPEMSVIGVSALTSMLWKKELKSMGDDSGRLDAL